MQEVIFSLVYTYLLCTFSTDLLLCPTCWLYTNTHQIVGYTEDKALERVTVAEAAKRLGVTQEAVRGRIKRDTIQYEKDPDGKTCVYLTPEETEDNDTANDMTNAYISALTSQIQSLKEHVASLEADKEHFRQDALRKDHLLAVALERHSSHDALVRPHGRTSATPGVVHLAVQPGLGAYIWRQD
jgi:hypothetical protein